MINPDLLIASEWSLFSSFMSIWRFTVLLELIFFKGCECELVTIQFILQGVLVPLHIQWKQYYVDIQYYFSVYRLFILFPFT